MYALTVSSPCTNHPLVAVFTHPIQPLMAYKYLRVNAIHLFQDLVEYNGFDDFTEGSFDVSFGFQWLITVDSLTIRMSEICNDDNNLFNSIDVYNDTKNERF